jgi:DNA-binding NtrC family response regulator
LFTQIFQRQFEIFTCNSADKGLSFLEENRDVKLVFSDMSMPVKNGLQFIQEASSKFDDVKFVMLSGYAINQRIQEAIDQGLICSYLNKPFDIDQIALTIKEFGIDE